jgi:hypothetical protein
MGKVCSTHRSAEKCIKKWEAGKPEGNILDIFRRKWEENVDMNLRSVRTWTRSTASDLGLVLV